MGFFIMLLISALMTVVGELLRPKPDLENAKPKGIGDFQLTTATEERSVPMLWGTVRISGPNITWYGDLLQTPITVSVKTGMFSSDDQITGFKYSLGVQTALCQGPDVTLRRVWVEDDEVLDATASPITGNTTFTINKPKLFGGNKLGSGGIIGTLRFFDGSASQVVSSYLSANRIASAVILSGGIGYSVNDVITENGTGTAITRATFKVLAEVAGVITEIQLLQGGAYTINSPSPAAMSVSPSGGTLCTLTLTYGTGFQAEGGDTPAYHDICYTIPDIKPVFFGTSTSIKGWKYECRRIPNGLALTGGIELVDDGANIANVIFEALTNAEWGYGIAAAKIDTANFITVATTLSTEGNGFSFLLDRPEELPAFINRLEEQMDGILFVNPLTGLWQINLARSDYEILTVPEINSTNILEIRRFSRGTWEGTSNEVHTPFNDATDDYKGTFGFAQDMANHLIVGKIVSVDITHPGIKSRVLANNIATRELRTLSIPLAQGVFIVDRSLFGVVPGDVIGFTDARAGFDRLPMRIKSVDYGSLLEGRITLECVQDVFFAAAGIFAPAPNTGWTSPALNLVPFPANDQISFEAPRALTARDPLLFGATVDFVYAAARRQGNEVSFLMVQRNTLGTPSGSFTEFGQVFQYAFVGELQSALAAGSATPLTSLSLIATPDSQADLSASIPLFPTLIPLSELGSELTTLCIIDDEFILIESVSVPGSLVQLNNVYRGALDSVQEDHVSGSPVFMIFIGGGMSNSSIVAGNTVEVKLLPESSTENLVETSAIGISFTMANRTRRPMPPASFAIGAVAFSSVNTTPIDIDADSSGDIAGMLVQTIIRRDFRNFDEIVALTIDAALIQSDFPAANSTTVEVDILNGVTVLSTAIGITGTSVSIPQLNYLNTLNTTQLPVTLTIALRESHTFEGTIYTSRSDLKIVFNVLSALVAKHAFGSTLASAASPAPYTVVSGDAGTDHTFTLSSAFTAGDVEYKLDAGAFQTLFSPPLFAGSIPNASLSIGTVITIQHLSTDVSAQKLCTMTVGANTRGYAVFKT